MAKQNQQKGIQQFTKPNIENQTEHHELLPKSRQWFQMLRKGTQILLHMWHRHVARVITNPVISLIR